MNDSSSITVDTKGKGKAVPPPNSAKAIAAAAAERDAKLRKMCVVVPPGDESKTITCPICKETLQTEFNEDEEEWVWRNAIRAKTKVRRQSQNPTSDDRTKSYPTSSFYQVYHATCHADALASQTAARLLRDQTNGGGTPVSSQPQSRTSKSRSGTPESASLNVTTSATTKTASPLRRDRTISPPASALAPSLKRKSPSRDDGDGVETANGTPSSTLLSIPEENGALTSDGDQPQPNKRARTSPPADDVEASS